ncbi:MAG TPA: glycosyltransferase, exosortase A system-associated [Gammaproteobacteria bacterium]|nr:glycosyltransferase, exosortase A system-associated [Gammaproteobacteria bacterium]
MRILHVLDHSIPLHSGYTFRTLAIIKQQRAIGWETFHVTGEKQGATTASAEELDGLVFYRTPPQSGLLARLPLINQLSGISSLERTLRHVIDKVKPDILHAHSPALNGVAALRAGSRFNLPVVYEVRAFWEDAAVDHGTSKEWGVRYRLTRRLETYVLKRADAITTICQGLRGDIIDRDIPAHKITVIPNAVDTKRFSMNGRVDPELQARLGLAGKTVLGFIGSFYAYEGLTLLLEALPGVLKEMPNVRVLLVGGGPQESLLRERVNELGLNETVIFTGRVPHDTVQAYYNLIDVFVYPRLPMRLTDLVTPLKPLEAMAQGRLVLASDVGGHRELIHPGINGELFAAGDAAGLTIAALNLLRNRDHWQSLHEGGRHFVESERTWPQSVARYNSVYTAVLG